MRKNPPYSPRNLRIPNLPHILHLRYILKKSPTPTMLLRPPSIEQPGVSVLPLFCSCQNLKYISATVKVDVTPEVIGKKITYSWLLEDLHVQCKVLLYIFLVKFTSSRKPC